MENCLVTKLKGVVDNDNLNIYGYYSYILKGSNNTGGLQLAVTSGTIKLIGGTYSSDGSTPVREIVASPNNFYRFEHNQSHNTVTPDVSGGDVKILLPKYTVYQYIEWGNSMLNPDGLEYSSNLIELQAMSFTSKWDISNLSKWTNIRTFIAPKSNIVGDVSVLATLPLTRINIGNIKDLTGSLDACGALALTELRVPNTRNVSLSIENFVTYARNAGRTTGSLNMPWVGAVNCTFNGASVSSKESNSLSWTATTITFNDVTIDA